MRLLPGQFLRGLGLLAVFGFGVVLIAVLTAPTQESLSRHQLGAALSYSSSPKTPKSAGADVGATHPQPTVAPSSKPSDLLLRGEYARAKACIPIDGGSALCELNIFNDVRLIQGSQMVRDRFQKTGIKIRGLGRLHGQPGNLVDGRTYRFRLRPSDETWRQIERGDDSLSCWAEEPEILDSITPEASREERGQARK
jgi:hypothetical protein